MDLRDLELEETAQEALVGPADQDLRAPDGAPDFQHEGLHVLADAVVLERALLGRAQHGLDVLAEVQDQPARLDPVDRAVDELALTTRELVEDLVALDLADALEDDLLGGLGADPAEHVAVQLLRLDHVAEGGVRIMLTSVLHGDIGQLVADLLDDAARAKDPDLPGLGVDPNVDVLIAGDPAIGRLDAVLHRTDELLTGDLLLRVELKEGAHEVSTHAGSSCCACPNGTSGPKK